MKQNSLQQYGGIIIVFAERQSGVKLSYREEVTFVLGLRDQTWISQVST